MCYLILLLTIIIPPIGIFGGMFGLYQNFRRWKIYIFCIAIGIASIAYCYYPNGNPDIIRYTSYINSLKGVPLYDIMHNGIKGETNTFVFSFFCWIAVRLNDPHIIPAASTFCVYYCGLYVTCQIGEDNTIKRSTIVAYVFFIILSLNLYSIINNVRNVFSFSIVSFAIFRDLYQKKRNLFTWILYLFPIFVHQSAILLILVRLAFNLASRIKIIMLIMVGTVNVLANTAHSLILMVQSSNIVVDLIKTIIIKADMYLNDTTSSWGLVAQRSVKLTVERVIDIAFAVFISLLILYIVKSRLSENGIDNKRTKFMRDYSFIICLLTISCVNMLTPEFWRFYSLAVLFSAVSYFEISKFGSRNIKLISNGIYLITPISCVIWIHSIINSDLTKLLLHPFISSPIIIMIKALINIV